MGMETALIAMAAGTGMQAVSAYQAGKQENEMAKANAAVLEQEAKAKVQAGRDEASLIRERARKLMAAQIAAAGAGGGDLGGSTGVIIADSAYQAERDAKMTMRNANLQGISLQNQASITRAGGKAARRAGSIRAATSVVGGLSNMYMSYHMMGGGGMTKKAGWGGMNTTPGFGSKTYQGSMYA